jgi:hypothetical protein
MGMLLWDLFVGNGEDPTPELLAPGLCGSCLAAAGSVGAVSSLCRAVASDVISRCVLRPACHTMMMLHTTAKDPRRNNSDRLLVLMRRCLNVVSESRCPREGVVTELLSACRH